MSSLDGTAGKTWPSARKAAGNLQQQLLPAREREPSVELGIEGLPRALPHSATQIRPGSQIEDGTGESHAIETRGSSTRSVITARRSLVIGGVSTRTGGTSSPRGRVPKYFSTIARVRTVSMSPTIAIVQLLGA